MKVTVVRENPNQDDFDVEAFKEFIKDEINVYLVILKVSKDKFVGYLLDPNLLEEGFKDTFFKAAAGIEETINENNALAIGLTTNPEFVNNYKHSTTIVPRNKSDWDMNSLKIFH